MPEPTRTATGFQLTAGAVLLLGLGNAGNVLGQRSDDATVDLTDCVGLDSAEERYACAEARVKAVLDEREGAAANEPADRPSEPAPGSAHAEDGERSSASAREATIARPADASDPARSRGAEEATTERAAANDEDSDSDEIVGTITALRERLPNSYLITLDNGQIWRQVRPKWYPLRPGLEVRIYPTRWGDSLRLTAVDGGGYIQVERAR